MGVIVWHHALVYEKECAEKWCPCGYDRHVQADRSDVMRQATKFTAAWCRHYGHYGYDGQCSG